MDNLLPDLPGFDTSSALKMLNNNAKLYGSILKRFCRQYTDSSADLAVLLKSGGNWENVQREAHTLKGLAGNIGHPALKEAAQALELSVKDAASPDPTVMSPLAEALLGELSGVLDTLKRAYPE